MLRSNNYTTILLLIIVLMLFVGLGITLYYVLDLDWFSKPVDIYNEVKPYVETPKIEIKVEKELKYDVSKRTYNLVLDTEDMKIVVYKDGTVGITMLANETNKEVSIYKEILNKEVKVAVANVVRAYQVKASTSQEVKEYIVLLDSEGNLHKLVKKELATNGKYSFVKIEGLAKIIDVKQITNDNLTENTTGVNAIAIDEESNELLLTSYLLK